jgi:succinate dehydrogenase hydrophobic anchor subunit
MSTTLYRLQLVAASALALVPSASAQLSAPPCPAGINCDGTSTDDIKQIIVDILTTVLDFVLLLALVYVIVAGLRLIISGGDEGEKDKAKKTIIYVIVGIIVIILARVIVTFVADLFV